MFTYVGCLGKLPFHAEFIRSEATHAEVISLDQQVQEGLVVTKKKLGSAVDTRFTAGPTVGYFWKPDSSGKSLVGVAKPSRDKAGRLFPFMIFAGHEAAAPAADAIVSASRFTESASALTKLTFDSVESVHVSVANLRDTSNTVEWRGAADHALRSSPDALQHGGTDRRLLLIKNLFAVADSVESVKGAKLDYGLGFALPGGSEFRVGEIAFVIALCARILPGLGSPVAVFWAIDANSRVVLFFSRSIPSVPVLMMSGGDVSDDVFDLSGGSEEDAQRARELLPARLVKTVDSANPAYSDILNAL